MPENDDANLSEPGTSELAARVQAGDVEAFAALYDRLAPALFAWANLRVHAPLRARLDPEDVIQEVSCRALLSFATFDPARGSYRRWFFGVANNVLKAALLQLSRQPIGTPSQPAPDLASMPDEVTSISRRTVRDESRRAFIRDLDHLAPDDRRLLLLRGLEGLAHSDVATLMGIGIKTAEKRWERLLAKLRENPLASELF